MDSRTDDLLNLEEVSLSSLDESSRSSSPMSFHITIQEYSGDQLSSPNLMPPSPPPPPPPSPKCDPPTLKKVTPRSNKPRPKSPLNPTEEKSSTEEFRLNDTKPLEKVEKKLDTRDQMLLQIRERAVNLKNTFSKERCGPPPSLQNSLFVQFIDNHLLIDDYTAAERDGDSKEKGKVVVVVQKDSPTRAEDQKEAKEGGEEKKVEEEEEGELNKGELTGVNTSGEGKGGTWVNDLISYLSEWLYHVARVDDEEATAKPHEVHESIDLSPTSSFWHEWEWVLSKSEEMAIEQAKHQTKEQRKQVKEELSSLRNQGSRFRHRPFFRKSASIRFEQSDDETRSWLGQGLDLSKRNKIMRDTVKSLKEDWIASFDLLLNEAKTTNEEAETTPPSPSSSDPSNFTTSFETLFDEKPYEKNLEGAIVSMGLLASHGASRNQGLTPVLLSDICWNIWSVLCHSIRKHLDKESLSPEELDIIAREAVKAEGTITSLWAETAKNARSGSSREGQVVEVWKEEEKIAEEKKLRENLPPDFKYSPLKAEPIMMRKSTLTPQRLTVLRSNLSLLLGGSTVGVLDPSESLDHPKRSWRRNPYGSEK